VLIEKPIAASQQEALELIQAADQAGRLLQVGHIERFNPAFRELVKVVANEEVVVLEELMEIMLLPLLLIMVEIL
jgi:predicted dehydrogenase